VGLAELIPFMGVLQQKMPTASVACLSFFYYQNFTQAWLGEILAIKKCRYRWRHFLLR